MSHHSRFIVFLLWPFALTAAACGGDGPAPETGTTTDALDLAVRGRAAPDDAPAPADRSVPAGATLTLRLDRKLSARNVRTGEGFSTTLTDSVVGPEGNLVLEPGATIYGRITAVRPPTDATERAVITIAYESIAVAGETYPLRATLVEVSPERRDGADGEAAADTAAPAVRAPAGILRGAPTVSDTTAAPTGTAVALGTANTAVVLPAGSRMVIRLDESVALREIL